MRPQFDSKELIALRGNLLKNRKHRWSALDSRELSRHCTATLDLSPPARALSSSNSRRQVALREIHAPSERLEAIGFSYHRTAQRCRTAQKDKTRGHGSSLWIAEIRLRCEKPIVTLKRNCFP